MKKLQRGFSIVTAIFLIVVLAGLGAAMVTFSNVQHQSSALDVMGSRAYQASRAGIEWAAFQIVQSGVAGTAFASNCQAGNTTGSPVLSGTLNAFTVSVSCRATSAVENATTIWMYAVASSAVTTGTAVGTSGYVERQMTVTIAQ